MPISIAALDQVAVLDLQRTVGNRAVTAILEREKRKPGLKVQRAIGWKTDKAKGDVVSDEGYAWNAGQHEVGKIHRIPLQGLTQGLQQESATRKGKTESTMLAGLSPESAKGRAIVLVPEALKPNKPIEVLVHLHGYTESTGRPFAGLRALTPAAGKTKNKTLRALRQGIDKNDVAPVRDVALDRAEQQLEGSGYTQEMIVLPQGGLHSQFGKSGDTNFDSGAYVNEILTRLVAESVWDPAPARLPEVRVSMSGHSGAGATLSKMARESVNRQAGKDPGASSTLTGDLVLLDAINPGEGAAFKDWALMRLDQDLAALKGKSDADKLVYLRNAQKLRGYYSTGKGGGQYVTAYTTLQGAIDGWFKTNGAELGPWAGGLRANFVVDNPVPVSHEELMRGVAAGQEGAGKGSILDALKALHPAAIGSPAAYPPLPASAMPDSKPASKPVTKPAGKPAVKPGTHQPAPEATRQGRTPRRTRHSAKAAAPAKTRAEQIATAILLAKTGGQGQGKTKEEKQTAKEAAEKSVAADILKGTKKDVDTWFASFEPGATFLGLTIRASSAGEPPGVHHQLAVVLKAAEASLVKAGEKPADAALRLGVKDIAGLRVPKTPTGKTSGASMHCFGLAVDIDHDNNPFIGNADKPTKKKPEGGASIQIIAHASLLLGGAARDPLRAPPGINGHETDSKEDRKARAERADEQWKLLNADSVLVQQYLSMTSDQLDTAVADRLPALTAWQQLQTAEPVQDGKHKKKKKKKASHLPWVEHVSDPAWWRDQHERDIKQSGSGDFGRGTTSDAKKFGFMTLQEEVVKALVMAGLSWGGAYKGDKDIMHFDLRTGSIGGRPIV
ncbi:MAG: hypothetical protein E6J25_00765 [Chloroflexi bacterium]|nr:MAG: hypothetical protein E6J25_00765 [Chloroflexota bacterium]